MAINLKRLGDRVLVQPREKKQLKNGGIIIPDTAKEKPQEGTVVAVGIGKLNEWGVRGPVGSVRQALDLRRRSRPRRQPWVQNVSSH